MLQLTAAETEHALENNEDDHIARGLISYAKKHHDFAELLARVASAPSYDLHDPILFDEDLYFVTDINVDDTHFTATYCITSADLQVQHADLGEADLEDGLPFTKGDKVACDELAARVVECGVKVSRDRFEIRCVIETWAGEMENVRAATCSSADWTFDEGDTCRWKDAEEPDAIYMLTGIALGGDDPEVSVSYDIQRVDEDGDPVYDDGPIYDVAEKDLQLLADQCDNRDGQNNDNMDEDVEVSEDKKGHTLAFVDAATGALVEDGYIKRYDDPAVAKREFAMRKLNFLAGMLAAHERAGHVLEYKHDGTIIVTTATAEQKAARRQHENPEEDPCSLNEEQEDAFTTQEVFNEGGEAYEHWVRKQCFMKFVCPKELHLTLEKGHPLITFYAKSFRDSVPDPDRLACGFWDGDGSTGFIKRGTRKVKDDSTMAPGRCADYYNAATKTYDGFQGKSIGAQLNIQIMLKVADGDPMPYFLAGYYAEKFDVGLYVRSRTSKKTGNAITLLQVCGGGRPAANWVIDNVNLFVNKRAEAQGVKTYYEATGLGGGTGGNQEITLQQNQARCHMVDEVTAAHQKDRAEYDVAYHDGLLSTMSDDQVMTNFKGFWYADGGVSVNKKGEYLCGFYQSCQPLLLSFQKRFATMGYDWWVSEAKKIYDSDFKKSREAFRMELRGGQAKQIEFANHLLRRDEPKLPDGLQFEKDTRLHILIDHKDDTSAVRFEKYKTHRRGRKDVIGEEDS